MGIKRVKADLKKVISYEKEMKVDVIFFSRFLIIYAFMLFCLSFIYLYQRLPYMTLLGFIFSVSFFIFGFIIKDHADKKIFLSAFLVISVFIFGIIFIVTSYGVTKGFSNFYVFLACNICVYSFGIVFSLIYIGFIALYLCLFFWTPFKSICQQAVLQFFHHLESATGVMTKQNLYEYSNEYCILFPLLFIVWFVIVIVTDYFIRLSQIKEAKLEAILENNLQKALDKTELQMFEGIKSIIRIIDEKDNYTKQHSVRVAQYSRLIAERYGINDEKVLQDIYRAALLHDIGKIATPDSILNKARRLTDEEFEIMKKHPECGYQILNGLTFCPDAAQSALNHHEKLDGTGYPNSKTENEIPFVAKIVSAADTLDAMNSDRVYRKKCSKEFILSEFNRIKGTQIDSEIAGIVCSLIEEGKIEIA